MVACARRHLPAAARYWPALVAAAALCLTPAPALAQDPFSPLPSQPTSTPTVTATTPTSTSTSPGSLSTAEQISLLVAGLLLIGGIAFLIRRDAHAQAPAGRPAASGARATITPRAKRVEQSRARAKAARRARKRSR